MLAVGLIWALVLPARLAIAPVFAFTMAFHSRLVTSAEARNKAARDEVAKVYFQSVLFARDVRLLYAHGSTASLAKGREDLSAGVLVNVEEI